MSACLFNFTGFAVKTDLERPEWRRVFDNLESKQNEFLKHQDEFRSKAYAWPRDPLHTWSRLWEYPYVYSHIQKIQEQRLGEKLRILDYGSGVTFFPFAIAQLGCDVICADIDPIVAVDIPEAAKRVQHTPGSVDVAVIENGRIPLDSETQDVVYCISVLEHIPNFGAVIDEMARVLRPGGHLILTVDIDLRGNYDLGINEFTSLQFKLEKYFVKKLAERPVHPSNLLTTDNSHYHMEKWSYLFAFKQFVKGLLCGKLVIVNQPASLYLTVYSGVFVKINA